MIAPFSTIAPGMLAMLTWQSGRSLPLVALLAVALGLVAAVLYFPQTSRLDRPWRWALFGLRTIALLALAASILQPAITRPAIPEAAGAIVVLVDRSPSMRIVDRQRGTEPRDRQRRHASLVALADGLGRLPIGTRVRWEEFTTAITAARSLLDEVQTAQSQVDYAMISGRGGDEARARLDAAAAMFDAAVAALGARREKLRPNAPLAAALSNLQMLADKPRDENWGRTVRAGIDAAAIAADNFQIAADNALYNNNPAVRAVCDQFAGLSRLELVEQAMVHPQTGLLWNLPAGVPLYGFSIGNSIAPLPLRGEGQPIRRLLLDTESTGGDLAAAVRLALDQLHGVPVSAVVLLSDGGQPVTPRLAADMVVGAPLYTIAAAPAGPVRDLALGQITVPASAYAGETFTVSARLRGIGMPNAVVDVRCFAGPRSIAPPLGATAADAAWSAAMWAIASDMLDPPKRVQFGPADTTEAEFERRIDFLGPQRVTLRIPSRPDEITADNNAAERWIKIFPDKRKITLVADAPVWDERYLRDFLSGSPAFEMHEHFLDDQPLAMSPADILEQDVVVLFDVPIASLNPAQQAALHRLVEERGGAVVLVAGPHHLPMEYANGPLGDLLPYAVASQAHAKPVVAWREWGGDDPAYHIALPPGAADGPRLANDAAANHRAWDALPPLYRYLPLPALKPGAAALLVERESGLPVIAESRLGHGHSMLIGIDEMWRWRYKTGPRDFERIWKQLLEQVMEPPYAASSGRLSLDVADAAVAPGRTIAIRGKLVESDGSPSTVSTLELRVLRDGVAVHSQMLSSDPLGGRFSGILPGLPAGDYDLELSGDMQAVRYPLRVISQYAADLEGAAGNRPLLDTLAKANGGAMLPLEQVNQLPGLLAAVAREPRFTRVNLWDSGYLFTFVVACFVLEWSLRKRLGLL